MADPHETILGITWNGRQLRTALKLGDHVSALFSGGAQWSGLGGEVVAALGNFTLILALCCITHVDPPFSQPIRGVQRRPGVPAPLPDLYM